MAALVKCEIIPLAGQQASFRIDGIEQTRWNFHESAPRPFFFPVNGPTGTSLTRMGHPGAPNHDHHASVWFAHHKLLGIDFWGYSSEAVIRQQRWSVYEDGDEFATMACQLGWYDGHNPASLVDQELIVTMRPLDNGEYTLDLQSTFTPTSEEIEFQQTNFGFFAVRVAKDLSGRFGGGTITGASGETGEKALFGKPNAWMDYTGQTSAVQSRDSNSTERQSVTEGITYFDHPLNATFPSKWHVREDGWMGASACRDESLIATRLEPIRLRYLLHVHSGAVDPERANAIAKEWAQRPMQHVTKSSRPHYQFEVANDS